MNQSCAIIANDTHEKHHNGKYHSPTAVATALSAGLFYAYSCSVNPGLGRLPDEQYIAAMQSINQAILNPVFFASFMGTLVLLPISAYQQYGQPIPLRFWLLLCSAAIYAFGTFGVTMPGNVALNNALDQVSLNGASAEQLSNARKSFELPWNRLHTIRTVASVASLVLVLLACITAADKPD